MREARKELAVIQDQLTETQWNLAQMSAWKRRAVEGMKDIFSTGAERSRGDHEAEVQDLQAKIGESTVKTVGQPASRKAFRCGVHSKYAIQ